MVTALVVAKLAREASMKKTTHWTVLDETTLLFARTMEHELRRTHGTLFAAAFLDEFDTQISNMAMRTLLSQQLRLTPPDG